jgi:hypothetical protein
VAEVTAEDRERARAVVPVDHVEAVARALAEARAVGRREFACEVGALIVGRVHLGPRTLDVVRARVEEAVPRG